MSFFQDLWNAEFTLQGQHVLSFLIFNLLFMLMGRFRFCFISSLFLLFFMIFFENRKVVDGMVSDIGGAGLLIGGGAIFLGLSVWSFFIDSD